MKIAILSTFYPYRGGLAQFNAELYKELARDHEVRAFNFSRQYPSFLFPGKTQYVEEGDDAVKIESLRVLDTINPLSWCSTVRKIAQWGPDLVIVRYWMSFFAPSLGIVIRGLRKRGIKVVSLLDNVIPHERRFFDNALSRWFLKQNGACAVMSRKVLGDMLSLAPTMPHSLVNHPLYENSGSPMPKTEARNTLNLPQQAKILLFFGFIRQYKGLDLLIGAMPLLPENVHLVIAGESYGPFDGYEKQIAESGAAGRIHTFIRYIADGEIPLFMSAADLCVFPYRSATQSGITGITVRYGLPCVATPAGGLAESVGGAGIGEVASGISSPAIAEAVTKALGNGDGHYLPAIGQYRETHTWKALADGLIELSKAT